MGNFFDRFKKQVPEAVPPVIVEKLVEVEKIVKVESSDRDILAAILRELEISNELHVFKLNPDDVQRKHIATARGVKNAS